LVGKGLSPGGKDGNGGTARFVGPAGGALDSSGNAYVADVGSGVRKVTPSGVVTTLITAIRPRMLGRDANGDLVAASSNAIWRVSLSGTATLLAGNPAESGYLDAAVGTDARFGQILGLAIDGAGNVFVSENINQNSTIRRITPQGAVSTWAGVPGDFGAGDGEADGDRLSARFRSPKGLAFDSNGNPQEIQVCFQWNLPGEPSGSGNVMVISGLTPDLARSLDQMIDGKPDSREGMFRQEGVTDGTPGGPGAEWSLTNTAQYNGGANSNLDEDQIDVVVGILKMNQ